jgi:hypothetical protein
MNKNPETADLVVDYNGERKKAVDYVFNKSTDIVSVLIVNGLESFFFRRRNANQVESLQNYKKISLMARRADESLNINYEEDDFKVTEGNNPLYIFVSASDGDQLVEQLGKNQFPVFGRSLGRKFVSRRY